jgi:hypothetical protein
VVTATISRIDNNGFTSSGTAPCWIAPVKASTKPGLWQHHQHPIIGHTQLNQRGGDCGRLIAQSRVTYHEITVAK